MKRLSFYDIDTDYVKYLKSCEMQHRGVSRVPDILYGTHDGKQVKKFMCGIAFENNGFSYFVPVSSNITQSLDSLLLIKEDDDIPIKGSLLFNYMFPAPLELAAVRQIPLEPNPAYQKLMFSELEIVRRNMDRILDMAARVYQKRTADIVNPKFEKYSCDFKFLEQKCREYCIDHHLEVPGGRTIVEIYQQDFRQNCCHREYDGQSLEFIERLERETKCLILPRADKYMVAIHKDDVAKALRLEKEYGIQELHFVKSLGR